MDDSFAAVALYAGLNAVLLVVLAINAGVRRRGEHIQPGQMGDGALTRAIRAHGNFTENAPLALLLLTALALTNTAALPIHALGVTFFAGRIAHALGMMRAQHPNALRFIGNAQVRRLRGSVAAEDIQGSVIVWDNAAELFSVQGGTATPSNPSGRVRAVLSPRADGASTPATPPANPLQPSTSLGERR